MSETTAVPDNASVPISVNKDHDTNTNISDVRCTFFGIKILLFLLQNSQLGAESTSISNKNSESSETPIQIQTNHSIPSQPVKHSSIYLSSSFFNNIIFI